MAVRCISSRLGSTEISTSSTGLVQTNIRLIFVQSFFFWCTSSQLHWISFRAEERNKKNLSFLRTLLWNGHQRHNKVTSSSQGIHGSSNAQKSCLWVLFCGRWWMLSLIMSSSQTSDSFWLLLDSTPPPLSQWLIEDGLVFTVQCVKVFSLAQETFYLLVVVRSLNIKFLVKQKVLRFKVCTFCSPLQWWKNCSANDETWCSVD